MAEFAGMEASLEAIFHLEGLEDESHLQYLTIVLRTASIDGDMR